MARNLFVKSYGDVSYVVANVNPDKATLDDVVKVFTGPHNKENADSFVYNERIKQDAHHLRAHSGFATLSAGSVMGCDADIEVLASASLDEDPIIGLRSAAGEFPTIYAPAINPYEAEMLIGLLDGAPDDCEDARWLQRKFETISAVYQ